eukprot:gb/GECH01002944.1/.p1 GENE.gb/GECH01002944.1/~~gb/GECH01002944.1/.p1  ORF type:complete len:419 (+),score=113.62 gb/GECH01002944.1/:1-1257(+)
MEKNNNFGKCSIADCPRPATVRNFKCLYGTWDIKKELQNNNSPDGKTLKICAAHYNEDLRLHPRDKSKPKTRPSKVNHHHRSTVIQPKVIQESELKPQIQNPKHSIYSKPKRRGGVGHKFIPNVTLTFNISNEPCLKYSLGVVADQSHHRQHWTSFRLKTQVMFIETEYSRFELSQQRTLSTNNTPTTKTTTITNQHFESKKGSYLYRWAKVNNPARLDRNTLNKINIPLDESRITIMFHSLKWNEIKWGPKSVHVRNQEFPLRRILFASVNKANETLSSSSNSSFGIPQTTSHAPTETDVQYKTTTIETNNEPNLEKDAISTNIGPDENSTPSSSTSSASSPTSSSMVASTSSASSLSPSITSSPPPSTTLNANTISTDTSAFPEKWNMSTARCGRVIDSGGLSTANKPELHNHEHS